MRERIKILADYRAIPQLFGIDNVFPFIFVVKPFSWDGTEQDEWNGIGQSIKATIGKVELKISED